MMNEWIKKLFQLKNIQIYVMHEFIKRKVAIYYYHNDFLVTLRKIKFEIFTITLIKIYISIFLRRFWKTNPFSVATRDHRKHTTTNAITIAPSSASPLLSAKCKYQTALLFWLEEMKS